jgi:hypothetical protein
MARPLINIPQAVPSACSSDDSPEPSAASLEGSGEPSDQEKVVCPATSGTEGRSPGAKLCRRPPGPMGSRKVSNSSSLRKQPRPTRGPTLLPTQGARGCQAFSRSVSLVLLQIRHPRFGSGRGRMCLAVESSIWSWGGTEPATAQALSSSSEPPFRFPLLGPVFVCTDTQPRVQGDGNSRPRTGTAPTVLKPFGELPCDALSAL